MAADIIITMCILYGLLRSKTGWTHTDRVSGAVGVTVLMTAKFHTGHLPIDPHDFGISSPSYYHRYHLRD